MVAQFCVLIAAYKSPEPSVTRGSVTGSVSEHNYQLGRA